MNLLWKKLVVFVPIVALLGGVPMADGQVSNPKLGRADKFRQLEEFLPTPNLFRTGSGRPTSLLDEAAPENRVKYQIRVTLDETTHQITGREVVTYTNNSREPLDYLWMQLDSNMLRPDSDNRLTTTSREGPLDPRRLASERAKIDFDGGYSPALRELGIDGQQYGMTPVVVKTMLRIELGRPLPPGEAVRFQLDWSYTVNNAAILRERTGYAMYQDDDPESEETRANAIYSIAQWHPRMVAFTDYTGWQHKQFLGRGEFALEFSDFDVAITVPDDHVVAATGTLANADKVLTERQRERYAAALTAENPIYVVTPDEAQQAERQAPSGESKTWQFRAENVRDFAFASSRKFIWDAWGCRVRGRQSRVLAMSFFPNEADGERQMWSRYSTAAVIQALRVYSDLTFAYPYDVAISVHNPYIYGMEYPMLSFNGPRPDASGSYELADKAALIAVIIHEVGHNWFPMIVNSDERQWTWMDEGLNSFLEYLSELRWDDRTSLPPRYVASEPAEMAIGLGEFPVDRGDPTSPRILAFMQSENQMPIMTNSESILQFGNNAYGKPATALSILRRSIMGNTQEESIENFTYAFRKYAQRWRFRHPNPADFYRSMEDASGIDLDWFWRGWFYTTDHVDLAVTNVRTWEIPRRFLAAGAFGEDDEPTPPVKPEIQLRIQDRAPAIPVEDGQPDETELRPALDTLTPDEAAVVNYYSVIEIRNLGGLVMPVFLTLDDGTDGPRRQLRIPAEIWVRDSEVVRKLVFTEQPLQDVILDEFQETADVDRANNRFPPMRSPSRFESFRSRNDVPGPEKSRP